MPNFFYGTAQDVEIWKSLIAPAMLQMTQAFQGLSTNPVRAGAIDAVSTFLKSGTPVDCRVKQAGVPDADYAAAQARAEFTDDPTTITISSFDDNTFNLG